MIFIDLIEFKQFVPHHIHGWRLDRTQRKSRSKALRSTKWTDMANPNSLPPESSTRKRVIISLFWPAHIYWDHSFDQWGMAVVVVVVLVSIVVVARAVVTNCSHSCPSRSWFTVCRTRVPSPSTSSLWSTIAMWTSTFINCWISASTIFAWVGTLLHHLRHRQQSDQSITLKTITITTIITTITAITRYPSYPAHLPS